MNWFNIIFVLIAQVILFWYISQMYGKDNKYFNFFSGLFLVLSFINIIVCVLSTFIITNTSFVNFNGFANTLMIFQLSILGLIIITYALKHVLEAFKSGEKLAKR